MFIYTLASLGIIVILSAIETPEGTKLIVSAIIRTGFVTFLCKKLLEGLGKKDHGQILGVTGGMMCGAKGIGLLKNAFAPINRLCDKVGGVFEGFNNFFEGVGDFIDKVDVMDWIK